MKVMFTITVLCCTLLCRAQVVEGTVETKNTILPAAILEVPFKEDVVQDALNNYWTQKGRSKSTELKGFTTFKAQQIAPAGSLSDLYFKVERKSRKEKEVTMVSLLLGEPGVQPTDSTRKENLEAARRYLTELLPAIEAYDLEVRIKNQTESLSKAESKFKNLVEDGEDLEKKKSSIEKKIKENKEEQEQKRKEIEENRKQLELLSGQKKS
jgi:DNA repair exonuclease SbcCD ATPase subunit